jgi:hypothetical protein
MDPVVAPLAQAARMKRAEGVENVNQSSAESGLYTLAARAGKP